MRRLTLLTLFCEDAKIQRFEKVGQSAHNLGGELGVKKQDKGCGDMWTMRFADLLRANHSLGLSNDKNLAVCWAEGPRLSGRSNHQLPLPCVP